MLPCDVEDTEPDLFCTKIKDNVIKGGSNLAFNISNRPEAPKAKPEHPWNGMVESYWKMAHAFSMIEPLIYEKWLELIEDDSVSFVEFVKRFQSNEA